MSKAAIETSDLAKRYPTSIKNARDRHSMRGWGEVGGLREILTRKKNYIQALNKVSLKVYRGEVFGLLGPNGAGKTTLIKILCTLVLPDGGEAYVNGYSLLKESSKVLRNLQAVLGDPRGFDWRLSARQNLEFYAALHGLPKDFASKRINELLEFTDLAGRAGDMYQRFSTGMARKLQLCRALLLDTPILLFDEPTAGLDPPSAVNFRHLLKEKLAKSEARTIFITTHNMWEAQSMCDRVAIINKGEIIACDSPENLRRYVKPEKTYVFIFDETVENSESLKSFLNKVEGIRGVEHMKPDLGRPVRVSIRVDENFQVSDMLSLIVEYGFRVKDLGCYEPSLEEAFIALVGRDMARRRRS